MFTGQFKGDLSLVLSSLSDSNALSDEQYSFYKANNTEVYCWGNIYNKKVLGFADIFNNAAFLYHYYVQKNAAAFNQIDGSFTFIITTPEFILFYRDHHGTGLPVYYTNRSFASSLTLLKQTPGFNTEPDYKALSAFLSIGYIATPKTSFIGVSKLGAGTLLRFQKGKLSVENLYPTETIFPTENKFDLDELSDQYGMLHTEAIRRRIGTHTNIGILLSGGYDSGCNLAALRKIYTGDVRSYSIGFKGDSWSELPLARCMSSVFNTIHTEYEIDGSEITALPDIVRYLGDPFVEGGLMVNYSVMRLVGSQKPDVILGGDGSDQYFGTSGREIALHYLLTKYGMKPVLSLMNRMLSNSVFDKNNNFFRVKFHTDKILNILDGDLFGFPDFRLKSMLQDQSYLADPVKSQIHIGSFEKLYTQHLYVSDIEKIINQIILFKASQMASMFHNTIAFPYMDLELYDFLKKLPVQYKCKGNSVKDIARGKTTAKFLLKYHYKPMLPAEITSKKKQGGFAPMPVFFQDKKQRKQLADFILSSDITSTFLKKDSIEIFINRYDREVNESGSWFWYKQNKAIQYFNLLTLAVWWETYVKDNDSVTI